MAFCLIDRRSEELLLSLWKFVHEDQGVITRLDPAGDVRVAVDFSDVIPPTHLDMQVKRLQRNV